MALLRILAIVEKGSEETTAKKVSHQQITKYYSNGLIRERTIVINQDKIALNFPDIDECISQPCQSNGTCVDEIDDYTCECVDGFRGKNCEESKLKDQHF